MKGDLLQTTRRHPMRLRLLCLLSSIAVSRNMHCASHRRPGLSFSARTPEARLELGLQVDPLATAGSGFVLGGFVLLQLKIRTAMEAREARDAALEVLRKAQVLLLAGKFTPEEVDRVKTAANEAADAYEAARKIVALGGALLRVPDPGASDAERLLERQAPPPKPPPATSTTAAPDSLDGVRGLLGLENRAPSQPSDSLLPTGSSKATLKDAAIGLVFVLQIGWFLLSLTDPMGTPNPLLSAVLTRGGEAVDEIEARKAAESAEYRAMLQAAVDSGEAPPTCATRPLDDPLGGCANVLTTAPGAPAAPVTPVDDAGGSDAERERTRGLDANRAWIHAGQPSRRGV